MDDFEEMKLPPMEIISTEVVEKNGVPYIRSIRKIDFGKAGVATVYLMDPCLTPEAQERRRQRLKDVCADLVRRGQIIV